MTAFCDPDLPTVQALARLADVPATVLHGLDQLRDHLSITFDEDAIVLGPNVADAEAFALADYMRVHRPSLGIVLVRHQVDAPLLGQAMRAGVRDVIPHLDVVNLRAAVARSVSLAATLRDQMPASAAAAAPAQRPRGRIVTVFSAKGGCGKTTLATNLAAVLADRGRRQVVLVDLDLAFGDVAIAMQLYPAHTIADAIPLAATLDRGAISALLTPHSAGLMALVAPIEPGTGDQIPATLISSILEVLRAQFDFVVVDTAPSFNDQVLAALDVSDVVPLIATLDVPALKNLKLTLETLDLLNFPKDRCHVIINRADSKVGLSMSEVQKSLRTTIAVQIPSSRDVPATINRGVPIVQDDPKHPVSVAIRTFAERYVLTVGTEHASPHALPAEARSDRRGFLRNRRSRTP